MDRPMECADEQTWRQFVAGELPAPVSESLRSHAADCDSCADLLRRVRQSEPATPEGVPHESTNSHAALTHTKLFVNAKDEVDQGIQDFDIDEAGLDPSVLTPSRHPGSMGRLGKYEILKVLGRGAFGIVLKGFDEQLRRSVAIKILNRVFSSSATARRRFIREARAAAAVSHPNVVAIHAVDEHAGIPFLVMEMVSGPSLRDRINDAGKLEPIEVIRLGAQIAAGMAAAHAQGVVHRDIKPGNIMLEANLGRVKITDFGLARVAVDNVELTSRGMAVGTPAYMSPEQVAGDAVDARSDLFALGCVLYAALVGHSPFQGRTALEMARRVSDYQPPPVHEVEAAVPPFLSELIARLLKKNPEERYQSAAEVADLLNRYLVALNQAPSDKFQSVLQTPFKLEPLKRSAKPRRSLIAAVAATIGMLVLVGGVWWWRDTTIRRATPDTRFTSGSGPGKQITDPSPPTSLPPAEPREFTVAQSGDAQFRTLQDALAQATPNTTIRVLDDATYRETLRISDPRRHSGLKLIAEKRATIVPADSDEPTRRLIEISHVSDVLLKGWKIAAPKEGHAVYVAQVGNVTLDDLICEQPLDVGNFAAIQVNGVRSDVVDGVIEICNCRLKTNSHAQCLWIHGSSQPPSEIRLIHNLFERRTATGTNVAVWVSAGATLTKLTVRENRFVLGDSALNLVLQGTLPVHSLDLVNNTFFQSRNWLAFSTQQRSERVMRVVNNLIVGGERILCEPREDLDEVARHWEFLGNWWERGPLTDLDATRSGLIAESKPEQSLRFLSRDPDHPDFLRPATDANWLDKGLGGVELQYLGAFGPATSP